MHPWLTRPLDRMVLRLAAAAMPEGELRTGTGPGLEAMLEDPMEEIARTPAPMPSLRLSGRCGFSFPSPVTTPWEGNNTVYGSLYRCGGDWRGRRTAILVHGWNDGLGYALRQPLVAKELNRLGVNAARICLPCHGPRRPREPGAMRDFLAGDPPHMLQAVAQAVSEIRSLAKWLRENAQAPVGVWGVSLGGWLCGLAARLEDALDFAVLVTPVVDLERAVRELPICRVIRTGLERRPARLRPLFLGAGKPRLSPERILLVAGRHDLFVPVETVESLAGAWRGSSFRCIDHGHISAGFSIRWNRWIARWVSSLP